MPKPVTTRSDVLESGYADAGTLLVRAVVLAVISMIALWLFRLANQPAMEVLSGFGIGAGFIIACVAGKRVKDARSVKTARVECPFCGADNGVVGDLTDDFHCEKCDRVLQVEDGKLVPIRSIVCTVCKAEHKVSVKATAYTCDNCGRTLRLTDPNNPTAVVAENSDVLRNYDVLLTGIGRQEAEVAMALQSILVCNLPDARKEMQTLPLTILRNVPDRKADALRRRFRELGAEIRVVPTTDQNVAARTP